VSRAAASPLRNRLLEALPARDTRRLRPHLEPVALSLGQPVFEPSGEQHHIYFPTSGIISLLHTMHNGSTGEIAVIGNEGVVGIALFMGGETSPSRAVVQTTANAYRMSAAHLQAEFKRGGELQRLLLRFTQALIAQMSQTAVCNRHHTIQQQLCRWLLMSLDRLPTPEVLMTQELIANMLGVRREGVTDAAQALQDRKLIRYVRGRIEVLDRPGVEKLACECYQTVKTEYDRLLLPAPKGV
jgi:CRP-like cAMP-binding protein